MNLSLTTMMPQATSSRRNVLLLVVAVLVLLLILRAGIGWYTNYSQELDATFDAKAIQFEKLSRLLAEANAYASERDALDRLYRETQEKRFIKGATPSLSEVAFQNLIKDMAQRSRVDFHTMRTLPTIRKDGLTLLQMNVSSRSEIGAILDFLLAVRNSEKFIYFSEVEITATNYHEARFFNFVAKLTALTQE